mmetsp:Transcript_3735/g.5086  ORF Transcript_3735/g.5086 Transcript_3735/m.5086 type:complete len:233 (-) Transcript_3735:3085-3783(-)
MICHSAYNPSVVARPRCRRPSFNPSLARSRSVSLSSRQTHARLPLLYTVLTYTSSNVLVPDCCCCCCLTALYDGLLREIRLVSLGAFAPSLSMDKISSRPEGNNFIPFNVTISITPTSAAIADNSVMYPPNVKPTTMSFAIKLNTIFSWMVMTTRLPILIEYNNFPILLSIKVISLISMAREAPSPMATPTSATAKAGASLIPSPHMSTSDFFGQQQHRFLFIFFGRIKLPT